jgi:hypothetical protein
MAALVSSSTLQAGDSTGVVPVTVNIRDAAKSSSPPFPKDLAVEMPRHGRSTAAEKAALRELAKGLAPSDNVQLLDHRGSVDSIGVLSSFDSMDITDCCDGGNTVPPDPHLAVGPNHVVAAVNVALEVYNKAGISLVGPLTIDSFMSANPSCTGTFDPNVLYDEESDRFLVAADADGTHFCIATSQTADPTGAWNIYAFAAQPVGGEFHDYPHFGVGDSYIVGGSNQFGGSVPGGFEGRVWAVSKTDMYAGSAATLYTESTGFEGSPQPLNLHGYQQGSWPSWDATHFFVTDSYDGCTLNLWEWNIPSSPSITSTFNLCAATGVASGMPISVPQTGGSTLEANDFRFRGFEYRNGSGWLTDSVSCNPGGGTVNCVRWAEIDLDAPMLRGASPTLTQAAVFSSDGTHRTFPDLAVDQLGNMAVGYTRAQAAQLPSVYVTGRKSTDPLGSVRPEVLVKAGEVIYASFDGAPLRWGDYTAMTTAPDGITFWYLGQYSKNLVGPPANWGTYVGSFSFGAIFVDGFEVGNATNWTEP